MQHAELTDAFVDLAYRIVVQHSCETPEERATFDIVCEICDKYDIPVRKYIDAVQELAKRLNEKEDQA